MLLTAEDPEGGGLGNRDVCAEDARSAAEQMTRSTA